MFLNRIHHSNKIFCWKLKNPKIRSLSLAETISSNLTRPWLFFFLIKLNPYTASAHSYIHFNRFTSTKFDQNFENLNLGICGCVGNTMISGEHSRGGKKRKHMVSRWRQSKEDLLNFGSTHLLSNPKEYFGQFVNPLIVNFYLY